VIAVLLVALRAARVYPGHARQCCRRDLGLNWITSPGIGSNRGSSALMARFSWEYVRGEVMAPWQATASVMS
jgi:hypothetical protein